MIPSLGCRGAAGSGHRRGQGPVEGGTWTYGFWDVKVHSNYYLGSKCHGSTVKFYNGSC